MSAEKIDLLNRFLEDKLPQCLYELEDFKKVLQDAATSVFGKEKKRNADWSNENADQILLLLADKPFLETNYNDGLEKQRTIGFYKRPMMQKGFIVRRTIMNFTLH